MRVNALKTLYLKVALFDDTVTMKCLHVAFLDSIQQHFEKVRFALHSACYFAFRNPTAFVRAEVDELVPRAGRLGVDSLQGQGYFFFINGFRPALGLV